MTTLKKEWVTPWDAAQLLADAKQPVEGMLFSDKHDGLQYRETLVGVNMVSMRPFIARFGGEFRFCHKEKLPLIPEAQRKAIIELFPEANWMAMDVDGSAWLYVSEPKLTGGDTTEGTWECDMDSDCPLLQVSGLRNYAAKWEESAVDLQEEQV